MNRHWRTLVSVLGRLARTPLATLLTIGVMGVGLSLPAGLYLLVANLGEMAGEGVAEPQITLFLKLDADRGVARDIETRLRREPALKSFRFVGRDQALADLAARSGVSDLAAGLARNPLPDAYVLTAREGSPALLERLRSQASQWPGVETAQLDTAWARRLHAILDLGRQLSYVVAALLGFGVVAGIGNTIRLQILARQEEIEVSRLIGATDRFIRLPFLYHGAIQGLLGGAAAVAILAGSGYLLDDGVRELADLYALSFRLHALDPVETGTLLAGSMLLGWLGAYLAVGYSLRHFQVSRR